MIPMLVYGAFIFQPTLPLRERPVSPVGTAMLPLFQPALLSAGE